ncbi:zinc-binding protein A33-like [Channa argus]|uniref:zinc-binding protein A33-like n=1 Tax=Channa argus TaxID=215402 RepID=UPI003522031C
MSSKSELDLSCPVCFDIFTNPVLLSCSHSFCRDCLQKWWREKQTHECPVCKKMHLLSELPLNLALKNLCEAFLLEKDRRGSTQSEDRCSEHLEKLKLFCQDHLQPVCVVCRDSKEHKKHRFRPIDEAARYHKGILQKTLNPLKEKLKIFEQTKGHCDQTAKHIELQTQNTQRQIKEQFKKLHQFLQEEEEARMTALKEEEEQKIELIKLMIEAMDMKISFLSDIIRATEENLRSKDVLFLQNYKAALERVQQYPLMEDPQLIPETLIDVAKHLGNLNFNIWNKMKDIVSYTPVILDPNSAHPGLILSEDLTSVRFGERQKLPDNPERFDFHHCVLGSEGFNSGTHSWDIEVRDYKICAVGVVKESVHLKGEISAGYLAICLHDEQYTAVSPALPDAVVSAKKKLERIRMYLDFDRGKLSFYDPGDNTHIHTFKQTFTEKLFPCIQTETKLPVKILPVPVSVTVEKQVPVTTGWFR